MEPRGSYSSGSRHFNEESNPDQHHSERSDRIRICIKVKKSDQELDAPQNEKPDTDPDHICIAPTV
jgi:hypothetical protein